MLCANKAKHVDKDSPNRLTDNFKKLWESNDRKQTNKPTNNDDKLTKKQNKSRQMIQTEPRPNLCNIAFRLHPIPFRLQKRIQSAFSSTVSSFTCQSCYLLFVFLSSWFSTILASFSGLKLEVKCVRFSLVLNDYYCEIEASSVSVKQHVTKRRPYFCLPFKPSTSVYAAQNN